MGSVRRISLISVGVVGKHKKTKSGSGSFVGIGGGGSPARIPPVPTLLPSAFSCASQVSLKIPSSATSGQRSTSSHTSTVDLRRAASLSFPNGGGVTGGPTTSSPATPVRSISTSRHSRPPSIASSTKRRPRKLSKSKSKPRKSEESSRDGCLKDGVDFQQEQAPFSFPSDNTLLKTPTRSTSSTAAPTIPLLPPIELQPPSPPRTVTTSHIQRRSRAYTTNEVEGLELETLLVTPSTSSSLSFFTPTSSLSGNSVGVGAGAVGAGGIFPLPPLSPNKLSPGKSPSQSQQSVSLGRSTAVNVSDEGTGMSLASGSGSGGLPRRNSLGDLKIPARISQAQVGLRRDLGMVREFASSVEREFFSCLLRLFKI